MSFHSDQTRGIQKQYFESLGLLIIKIALKTHEQVTCHLYHRIHRQATLMENVDNKLSSTGSARYQPTRTIYSSSGKEADKGITPHNRRPDPQGWPTLISESGISESIARLHADAKWWLTQSNFQVRAIVLAHIQVAELVIDIKIWRMHKVQQHRPPTIAGTEYEPKCDQNGHLHIDSSTIPATTVGTLPLFVFTFDDLVLRGRNLDEGDFALNYYDIQSIARVFLTSI
ncbi:hypothetical protein B9Z19DRAFT_1060924 [Tuber borchii]|uniref:Uncharacterized protein n=1 Tax=Tuber borchii TaxID=42251 RepID=A0A2T7A711_TUBBO|nr:hypothetical protein B9Z19DRAFT_1060924 [Tuber borchii]